MPEGFARGVDVSTVLSLEESGVTFRDAARPGRRPVRRAGRVRRHRRARARVERPVGRAGPRVRRRERRRRPGGADRRAGDRCGPGRAGRLPLLRLLGGPEQAAGPQGVGRTDGRREGSCCRDLHGGQPAGVRGRRGRRRDGAGRQRDEQRHRGRDRLGRHGADLLRGQRRRPGRAPGRSRRPALHEPRVGGPVRGVRRRARRAERGLRRLRVVVLPVLARHAGQPDGGAERRRDDLWQEGHGRGDVVGADPRGRRRTAQRDPRGLGHQPGLPVLGAGPGERGA